MVQIQRCAALRNRAVFFDRFASVEQDDFIGQSHRFDLVMGHVNHARMAHFFMQARDFDARLHTQCRIQIR